MDQTLSNIFPFEQWPKSVQNVIVRLVRLVSLFWGVRILRIYDEEEIAD